MLWMMAGRVSAAAIHHQHSFEARKHRHMLRVEQAFRLGKLAFSAAAS
jgi:hypothetical protein